MKRLLFPARLVNGIHVLNIDKRTNQWKEEITRKKKTIRFNSQQSPILILGVTRLIGTMVGTRRDDATFGGSIAGNAEHTSVHACRLNAHTSFPANTSNKINDIATEKGHTTLPEHISTTYKHFSNLKSPIVICGDMAKYLREGKKIEVHVPCASYICILLIFLQKIGPLCFIKMQMAHPCEEICWLREAKSV